MLSKPEARGIYIATVEWGVLIVNLCSLLYGLTEEWGLIGGVLKLKEILFGRMNWKYIWISSIQCHLPMSMLNIRTRSQIRFRFVIRDYKEEDSLVAR